MRDSDIPELIDDVDYQAIREANTARMVERGQKGIQLNVDVIYVQSMLEYMILSQGIECMADMFRHHQRHFAQILDDTQERVDEMLTQIERMQREATILGNGHGPTPASGPTRMMGPDGPHRPPRPPRMS